MGRDLPVDLPVDLPRDVPVDSVAFLGRLPIAGSPLAAFNGNTGGFSADSGSITVDGTNPIDGSGSLASSGGAATATNLDTGPQQGDIYCGSIRTPPVGGQSELWYGVQDSSNLYFVGVDSVADEVTLGFYSSGSKTVNATASASIAAGTVYDIELTWRTDGYQEAYVTERTGTQVSPSATVYDGFEDGDAAGWDDESGTFTVQTGTVHDGTYAAELETSGSAGRVDSNLPDDPTEAYAWVRGTHLQDYRPNFQMSDSNNGGTFASVGGHSDGEFRTYNGGGWQQTGITGYQAGKWFKFAIIPDVSGGTYDVRIEDDNGTLGTASGFTMQTTPAAWNKILCINSANTGEFMHYDTISYIP